MHINWISSSKRRERLDKSSDLKTSGVEISAVQQYLKIDVFKYFPRLPIWLLAVTQMHQALTEPLSTGSEEVNKQIWETELLIIYLFYFLNLLGAYSNIWR